MFLFFCCVSGNVQCDGFKTKLAGPKGHKVEYFVLKPVVI